MTRLIVSFPSFASICSTILKIFGRVLALQQSLIYGMALNTLSITASWLSGSVRGYGSAIAITAGCIQKSTMCKILILGAIANPAASQHTSDGVLRSVSGIFKQKKMSKWITTSRMQLSIEGGRGLHSARPEVSGVLWLFVLRYLTCRWEMWLLWYILEYSL
jgi:hypothetical protein